MKKIFLTLVIVMMAVPAFAFGYNYVSPDKVKSWIETGHPINIVDIQVTEEFKAHHLPGAIPTYSYPVKSDSDKAKLDNAVGEAKKNNDPVVIVCPRGKGGAKRCYDYLKENGVAEDRLLILEKGQLGWPHQEMVKTE
nr:rhodanese-like domain-containing protein [uncultured Desulfobacter sp.]